MKEYLDFQTSRISEKVSKPFLRADLPLAGQFLKEEEQLEQLIKSIVQIDCGHSNLVRSFACFVISKGNTRDKQTSSW